MLPALFAMKSLLRLLVRLCFRFRAYNTAAITCYALAGASAVVSTALFITDYRRGKAPRQPAVAVSPSSLTLTWQF